MFRFVAAFAVLMLSITTWAGPRQAISCLEQKRGKDKIKVTLNFDPTISRETYWTKDEKGRALIKLYAATGNDGEFETSARVAVTIPKSYFRTYSGRYRWSEFYSVNVLSESSDDFEGKASRNFHGHDKDRKWDMEISFPDEVSGKGASKFKAVLGIQMDIMDQGYYFFDLECQSRMR